MLVHCIPGVGKTGVFCVLAAAMQDTDNGYGVPDVTQVRVHNVVTSRKFDSVD